MLTKERRKELIDITVKMNAFAQKFILERAKPKKISQKRIKTDEFLITLRYKEKI